MKNRDVTSLIAFAILFSIVSFFLFDQKAAALALAGTQKAVVFWTMITALGYSGWMVIEVLFFLLLGIAGNFRNPQNPVWRKMRGVAMLVFASLAISGIAVQILKGLVGRQRPNAVGPGGEMVFSPFSFDHSFASWPSGHATSIFALGVALALVFPRLRFALVAIAMLVAFSRMALGAHYLGDVVSGAALGTITAVLIYRWLRPKLSL